MNIFLIIAIVVTNIVAITLIYQILKKQSKKEILIFIAASVTFVYLIISLVYWLSGFGIDNAVHENSKNFIIYLFVPVNVIIFVPYLAVQYKKLRQSKKIEKYDIEKLSTKVAIVLTAFIVGLVGQFFYFKSIQTNIKEISNSNQKITTNTIENTDINTNINANASTETNTNQNTSINTNATNNAVENSSNIISNQIVNQVNEV